MTLSRYNPWQEMNALQRSFNRLFDDMLAPDNSDFTRFSKVPAAELWETNEAVNLKIELPGMNTKDLDIHVTENAVSIKGERKQESTTEENGTKRTEFRYGKFERIIPLPARIQNTDVKADYKDGILNLHLPKAQEEKNKVVKVNLEPTDA
ncbi:Hsp20/alpha crystallin family protein [Plectonema cf. radiosum LEGE 06105]|uniref:Hsp20/alpha crystallin family protein n=1 Tax=Plectonema cf. radiosum LEGE 06105 TaxID=945769 RepID=A0A8J7K7S4_9CYAN|nr:Hsp20/alpha crystallin family protein [Plectonema radiosum]MBE9216282.1 Hsp20/alpha crystallin family protein [Plectonema cf. radiosum LEGE 06105]